MSDSCIGHADEFMTPCWGWQGASKLGEEQVHLLWNTEAYDHCWVKG